MAFIFDQMVKNGVWPGLQTRKTDTNMHQRDILNQVGFFQIKLRAMKTLPLFNQSITD
ncbi:hypothetical protein ORN12_12920 [Pantoea vagans]|uniref:hypothetical protein n=1 Tax=Pantoea vagans TaxID=470934 RepID=UPI00224DA202|nr:hypothetical protein [Pantoea vagans]MCX3309892.1 hypothetical protein [Pantoea vagans]